MSEPLILAFQGFRAAGKRFARRAKLAELAAAIGADLALPDPPPHNWPAALRGDGVLWSIEVDLWRNEITEVTDGDESRPVILLGHSDGATMGARLGVSLRDRVAAVVSYAALYKHWRRHEDAPGPWPPALFLNNHSDARVDERNALAIADEWRGQGDFYGGGIDGPTHPPASKLATHLWQPEVANPIVVEWLKVVLTRREIT